MEQHFMLTITDTISKAKIQLQVAKSRYDACKVNHQNLLIEVEQRHQRELKSLEEAIQKAEHEVRLLTDPKYLKAYQEKQERQHQERERIALVEQLFKEFSITYIPNAEREILLPMLNKLKQNQRLNTDNIAWLETEGKKYFQKHSTFYKTYHRLEAEYYVERYKRDKRVWNLVNASSHYRKAQLAETANTLLFSNVLNKIPQKDRKLRAAFWTTFGGVKRDLGKFHDGIKMAIEAHQLAPKDYRPCTLLGALHFEIWDYPTGTKWFDLAEKLGAPQDNTDAEIKSVYHKADKEEKAKLKAYLLNLNPHRYAWVNQNQSKKSKT